MIRLITLLLLLSIMDNTLKAQQLKTADDSLAYSLGVLIAGNLKQEGFGDLNPDIIAVGLKAALKGESLLYTTEACNSMVRDGAARLKSKQFEAVKGAGEQFLAANKKRAGVTTLEDGLQYEIMKEGTGRKPKATETVNVHYHGTLIDGTIFDSSVDRGEPISFPLNQVIKGWTEVLQLMPIGSKWKVYIPYQLAYGERGAGQTIPPYAALIFEIELLGIE
ncbi:MAG: FKBP-type peptidyl-prolyl cis-trans isomerase [Saprospiraceae bacterium]|nr:FKBP-type peptidyl-prolyl cis-trans isomerase [Candidatus Opimibacter iunctus]